MNELDLDAIRLRDRLKQKGHDYVDNEGDVPALIAEVERLREEREQMRRDLMSMTEGYQFMRALVQDYRETGGPRDSTVFPVLGSDDYARGYAAGAAGCCPPYEVDGFSEVVR